MAGEQGGYPQLPIESPIYPPTLTPEQQEHLISTLTDYALAHGLIVRPTSSLVEHNPNNALATVAPVTLWPSTFPREPFLEALAIQQTCNELYARIAADELFLESLMLELSKVDQFMKRLWDIHLYVKAKGYKQNMSLGLFRSDYMINQPEGKIPKIQQVEFNTISSSFGALSTRVAEMHRFLWKIEAYPDTPVLDRASLPPNNAIDELATGLASAHKAYSAQGTHPDADDLAVLFVVQEGERNVFDQRWLEYSLIEHHDIRTYRLTLSEIPAAITIKEDGTLFCRPAHLPEDTLIEISTIYYRAGYGPDDYTNEEHWNTRANLEASRAIKCPTVLTQLAGAKKVQQVLANPTYLSKFLPDKKAHERIFNTFTSIFPLDTSPEGLKARSLALEHPEKYVLKPQREGGGNNIYRYKIPGFLKSLPESNWSKYILMEIIEPPSIENTVVRNGELIRGPVVGELGVYGTILWEKRDDGDVAIRENKQAGWLLRTKGTESEEGGVAAGFGCVDSVVLVD